MAPNNTTKDEHVYRYVEMKTLPSFSKLQSQVQGIVRSSSWWDLYGVDWMHVAGAVTATIVGLVVLQNDSWLSLAFGFFLIGSAHGCLSNKTGHIAAHGGMADSPALNYFCTRMMVDFLGGFSTKMAIGIHIKVHHPHTNIIGLGDSSTWKVPGISRFPYMFLAPLAFPLITPVVAIEEIIRTRDWLELLIFTVLVPAGVAFHMAILVHISGFTIVGSLLAIWAIRSFVAIPYIHVNIFQHIGLPMYSQEDRPARIYQMSTGVLNLTSNPYLNATFGHSLISCHVEHHLFPKLSDNMCYKIRPLVSKYLQENGLPYNEDSYLNRVWLFLKEYDTLMVNAPPITHFVGLQ